MNSSSTPAAVIAAASDHPRGRSFSAHPYEQEHPESTRSLPSAQRSPLWKMLKGTVAASAALRVRKQRSDSRLDADGITFEDRGSGSFKASTQLGKHADQWQSLAHFFDNGEGVARARTPAEQPSTPSTPRTLLAANRGRRLRSESPTPGPSRLPQTPSSHSAWPAFLPPPGTPTHTPARSDTVHQSPFSAEPGSYIVSDPDRIPEGDDPLSYHSNAASLIDSSSDEESDDEGQTGAEKNARFGKQASGGSAQAKPQGRITQTLRKWTPRFELTPLRKGIREFRFPSP